MLKSTTTIVDTVLDTLLVVVAYASVAMNLFMLLIIVCSLLFMFLNYWI